MPSEDPARPLLLSDAGKRAFIRAFEERLQFAVLHPEGADNGPGKVAYRRCIELQARRMARAIRQGIAYQPFSIR